MTDYKALYFQLAARVADAIDLLVKAQQEGEECYLDSEDDAEGSVTDHE